MATGYSLIPINDHQLKSKEMTDYLANEMVFISETIPHGRFPSPIELREAIQLLGFDLEESNDWYVTSKPDFTEIWFKGDLSFDDIPISFWFRRGDIIVLDIAQTLANQCGSFIVSSESGRPTIVIVPDIVFPTTASNVDRGGFVSTMIRRLPALTERLTTESIEEILFALSQIHQALRRLDHFRQYEFFQATQNGLPVYRSLLKHEDVRVRHLAFDLIATFQEHFYEDHELLRLSIKSEPDIETKETMIYAIEHLVVPNYISSSINLWAESILELLSELSISSEEHPAVRLAAATLLARSQPGLITDAIRTIFVEVLIQPERYRTQLGDKESGGYLFYGLIEQTLKSIEQMLFNHRLEILITALPQMRIAEYAHDVLCALLDHVFFGSIRLTSMSSLLDDQIAERPQIIEATFIGGLSRSWSYPANPTQLKAAELLPTQRTVLALVIALDIPWMVHSNLLEKYGLPATRAAIRALLDSDK